MSASSDVVLIDDGDDDVVELESAARKDDAKRPLERAETPARKRQKVWNGVGQDEDELRALFPEVVGDPRPTKHDSQELLDARLSKFNLVDRLARVMGGIPEPLQPSNAHRSSWTVLQLRRRLRYGLLVQAVLNFRHASSVDLEATEDLASELRSGVRPLPETLLQRNRLGSGVALQLRRIGFLVSELTSYGKLCGVELFEAAEEEQDELEESKPSGSGTGSGSGSMSMSMTRARKPAENVLEDLACKTRHWAKGTGYGGTPSRSTYGGKGKGRKRKSQGQSRAQPAANAKREDKDDAIAAFLFEKALDVLGIVTSWAATLPHLNPVSADTVLDNGDIPLGCGAIRCLLRRSGVLMLLARYLREANVKEVSGAREATFQLAFALLLQLTATPCLAGLLFERLEDGAKDSDGLEEEDDIIEGATLASLCPTLLSMIEVYDKLQAGMTSSANSAMGIMNAMSGLFELAGSVCQHTLGQGGVDRETNAWDLVRDACQRVKDIERTLGQGTVAKLRNAHAVYRRLQSKGPEREDGGDEPEVVALKNDPDLKRYLSEMRALRFKSIENLKSMHSFAATYDADTGRRGNDPSMVRRMRRISTELANLAGGGLPVESGSAIFLRSDDEHLGLLKALIIGPEDTPYENGLFEFDIYLPMNYPNEPPKVQFLTTGGGRVRFNPNLYNNGKVCLSLIGTWSGPGWDKQKSSLLQVLISIQSLILVNHPYYNEPGFERVMGTKGGEQQSISYSFGIRGDTMQTAILDQLRQPPPAFADVVEVYRRRKRRAVLEQCRVWRMEAFALDASLAKLPKQKHQVRRGMHTKAKDFGPGMDRVCHTLELFLEESSSAAAGGGFKSPFATSASMPEDSVDRKSRRRKLLEAMNAFVGSSEVEVVATENQGEVITLEE